MSNMHFGSPRREPERQEHWSPARLTEVTAFIEDGVRLVVNVKGRYPTTNYDTCRLIRKADGHFVAEVRHGRATLSCATEKPFEQRFEFYPANVAVGALISIAGQGAPFEITVQPPPQPGLTPT